MQCLPSVLRPVRVLLVEQHHFTRLGLRASLSESSVVSVCAETDSIAGALQVIDKIDVDVALINAKVCNEDSIQDCRALREKCPNLRLVVLTAMESLNWISASLLPYAHGYCVTNVEPERLMMAVISAYYGDRWLDATIAEQLFCQMLEQQNQSARTCREDDETNRLVPTSPLSRVPHSVMLTTREMEVLRLIVAGHTNKAIADQLVVSLATAKAHVRSILTKLGVSHRTEAAVEALKRGIV